jgi:hypothetical protein
VDEIWSALKGLSYPVTREMLLNAAAVAGARDDLVERLQMLPNRSFADADDLGRALRRTRATSNPALVALDAKPCEHCGFPVIPGKPHSCIEEKALFAESVQNVTDEFEAIDDSHRGQ